VSLLASTNEVRSTGNTSPGASSDAGQLAAKSRVRAGAHPKAGGQPSNPRLRSASIGPEQHGGLDWLLLVLIAAGGLAAFGLVAAGRRTHSEVVTAEPPGPQRLRRASEAVAGAVGLLGLRDAASHRRRHRRSAGSSSLPRRGHRAAAALAPVPPVPNGATAEDTATAEQAPAGPASERIERVSTLQRQLGRLGLEPGPIDGHYGPLTAAAVERFQRAEALPVDGVVGPLTADRLRASVSRPPDTERVERVKALQGQLSWLGFEPGIVDGHYGPLTTGAVKRFQEAHDLPVDGVVGQGTRDALRASLAQRPSSDRIERVKALQRQLSRLGYEPGPLDGRYGPLTTAAVARFQDSNELPSDGLVDPATQRALNRDVMNPGRRAR
jgi:peptidoglycan hydrolase-like protein with peptidoglycan-binding domain